MRKLVINGGKPLKGEVTISGAKNSTVALIPAAIIAEEPVVLEGVPDIQDVAALIEILNDFNVKTEYVDGTLTIDPTEMKSIPMPRGKIQSMRASYYFMGALLGKYGHVKLKMPGGCDWRRRGRTSWRVFLRTTTNRSTFKRIQSFRCQCSRS